METRSGRPRAPARLIRFFRADAPASDMAEFTLEQHATWMVGRIAATWQPSAADPPRVFSEDDALMSSRHALIRRQSTSWEIEDAGSKNGTFVNGERLRAPRTLRDGDIVECGSSFFMYRAPGPSGGVSFDAALQMARHVVPSIAPHHYQIGPILPFVKSDLSIHLQGETGTGKEIIARAIHDLSGRPGRFIARNCAAIPDALFESELFGHVKGAFSGAVSHTRGQIHAADHGTLFLDEIGELSLPMQAKLLRVLELKEVLPIGSTTPLCVDFRLISATLCDLQKMVAEGTFRRDLLSRLGHTFMVPPLREHKEYIGGLMPGMLATTALPGLDSIAKVRFSIDAARAIVRHSWPFNIRELKHCVQSALTAASADHHPGAIIYIDVAHLPRHVVTSPEAACLHTPSERAPRRPLTSPSEEQILAALRHANGNRAAAARLLGVSERTVFRRLAKLKVAGPSS